MPIRSLSFAEAIRRLAGDVVTDLSVADAYWHGQVFLRTERGRIFEFFAEEHHLGEMFEVYSLASPASTARSPSPLRWLHP